jgi:hypothetical protein
VALERFLKFQPPTFYGAAKQDQQAEQWIEQIEDIYKTLQYTESQKVKFATFRLKGPARNWRARIEKDWEITQQEWSTKRFVE